MKSKTLLIALLAVIVYMPGFAQAAEPPQPKLTLISNVSIFDGKTETLHKNMHVLVEALKMVTSSNAEAIYLSGPRNSYQEGPLGVIEVGAYADMLLVDGNPLANIDLVADAKKNFVVIMKDGVIYKNTLQ